MAKIKIFEQKTAHERPLRINIFSKVDSPGRLLGQSVTWTNKHGVVSKREFYRMGARMGTPHKKLFLDARQDPQKKFPPGYRAYSHTITRRGPDGRWFTERAHGVERSVGARVVKQVSRSGTWPARFTKHLPKRDPS